MESLNEDGSCRLQVSVLHFTVNKTALFKTSRTKQGLPIRLNIKTNSKTKKAIYKGM